MHASTVDNTTSEMGGGEQTALEEERGRESEVTEGRALSRVGKGLDGDERVSEGSGDGGGVWGGRGGEGLETLWRGFSKELSGELPGGPPRRGPPRRTPEDTTHHTPSPHSLLQSPTTRPKTGDPNPPHKGKKGRGKGGFTHSNYQNFSGGEPPDPPQLPQDRPTVGRKDKKGGRARFARDPTKSIELATLFQTALSPPLHLLSFKSYSTPNFQTSHGVIRTRTRGTHTPSWGAISRGHTQVQNGNLDALDFA